VIVITSAPQKASHADSLLLKPVPPAVLLLRTNELLARAREVRARANAVVRKGKRLIERSTTLLERSRAVEITPATERACPDCGTPLEWIEEGTIGVRVYDYYRWCLKGCGLYCFDRSRAAWIKLA
jgi:uncharacterized protein with PIN domain